MKDIEVHWDLVLIKEEVQDLIVLVEVLLDLVQNAEEVQLDDLVGNEKQVQIEDGVPNDTGDV